MKKFSRLYVIFTFLTLIFIYLVFVAGSLVRITGSGMGCPDWPKCFGSWVPPTDEAQLPENYREIYVEKRLQKVEKFSKILMVMGFTSAAEQIKDDPELYREEAFNARKTWTEYANRLVGFMAGNFVLFQFFILLFYYKRRRLIWLGLFNLVVISLTGWLGSIVVASNLVPWTITVHMLLGLIIILTQFYILYLVDERLQTKFIVPRYFKGLVLLCFLITIYQIFLGTQVRESIDQLTIEGYDRQSWTTQLGVPYFIHRSFSWLVLIIIVAIAGINERSYKINSIRWIFALLAVALLSGILLAHYNMPGLLQTIHLISATILAGIMFLFLIRTRNQERMVNLS